MQQQTLNTGSNSQIGGVDYNKLDYEFFQGFHVYLTQDYAQLDFSAFNSEHNSYGIGIQSSPQIAL